LPGTSSCNCGAPDVAASLARDTAGKGRDRHAQWHWLHAGGGQIRPGINAQHTWHRPRFFGLDRVDDAMCVPAADNHRIDLVGQVDIVGIPALTAHQHRIFVARHRLTDAEFGPRKLVDFNTTVHRRTSIR
jgi:hypothetical protein